MSAPNDSQGVVVGNTHRFRLTVYFDGVLQDLTGDAIILTFVAPKNAEVKHYAFNSASTSPTFTNPVDTFDVPGDWSFSWKLTHSGIVLQTEEMDLPVSRSLAALPALPAA